MSERKNIERLFQEKFKDFEAAPSPKVWENIASKLEKKENKRRIIPFWLKASGIAASLLLGYFIVDNYTDVTSGFNSTENNNETVVSSELSKERSSNKEENTSEANQNATATDNTEDNQDLNQANQKNAIVTNENTSGNGNVSSKINSSNSDPSHSNQSNSTSNESLVSSEKENADNSSSFEKDRNSNQINSKNQLQQNKTNRIVNNKPKKLKRGRFNPAYINENQFSSSDNEVQSVAQNDKSKKALTKDYDSSVNEKNQEAVKNNPLLNTKSTDYVTEKAKEEKSNFNSNENQKTAIVTSNNQNSKENNNVSPNNSDKNTAIVNSNNQNSKENNNVSAINSNQNTAIVNSDNQNSEESNKVSTVNSNQNTSIVNSTNQNSNLLKEKQKDSVAMALAEENPLEKILKEKELKDRQEIIIADNTPKWKVRPNVAPIFMSASQGSPIDDQFVDNSKNFENTMSFGLGVDYALSSKFTIRTGVQKFDLGYNTNDIVYYADLKSKMSAKGGAAAPNPIQTINMRPQASGMIIEDKKIPENKEIASQYKEEGFLNQRLGYLEVPFEVSYKLIDKKFGIQVITGLSTLFLNKNEVSVVSSGMTTELGEANNLNKVHFSTNVGLGFKYSFWKSSEANFEPTFKYQINTFNANSGGFKPYLIGLYTGVSFKF